MTSPSSVRAPFDQSRYEVRLDWGLAGLARIAPADITVVVDVLRFSTTVTDAVARGAEVPLARISTGAGGSETDQDDDDVIISVNGARVAEAAAAAGTTVMLGCLRNAGALARAVSSHQTRLGERTSVAVIAAGERASDGSLRFAVEDHLGAGAVVDALIRLGIDHTSPEATVAAEGFRGLGGAVRHLLTASGSGQELIGQGRRDQVFAAAIMDDIGVVAVLKDGVFTAW